jgi:hypothetical protein
VSESSRPSSFLLPKPSFDDSVGNLEEKEDFWEGGRKEKSVAF